MAPLPRAYQWADGSAFPNHIELLSRARGSETPADFMDDPRVYQGGSDDLLGPHDDAVFADTAWGIDFEAELAVVSGDVAIGTGADAALDSVRLLLLANDWSLRHLVPGELAKGFGFLQSKPATAFAAGGGDARRAGHGLARRARASAGGHRLERPGRGAHRRRRRDGAALRPADRAHRAHAAAARRQHRRQRHRQPARRRRRLRLHCREARARNTRRWQPRHRLHGLRDRLRIEVKGLDGGSVFGAIDQRVAPLDSA